MPICVGTDYILELKYMIPDPILIPSSFKPGISKRHGNYSIGGHNCDLKAC